MRMLTPRTYKTASKLVSGFPNGVHSSLFHGDCYKLLCKLPDNSVDLVVTSPPYCIGMEYETENTVEDFIAAHKIILPEVIRITKPGGSICWQVGYHVSKRGTFPLDYGIFTALGSNTEVTLRNRIVWAFSHGLHGKVRFSGRHESILWFTKGSEHYFDLDSVRIPQKYPGKRHYKGRLKGEFSGNPLGKNPGDVWDIPNVKGNHVEKTDHPCQFPVALVQRLLRSLCPKNGVVLDPYMGSATTGVAALIEGRRFIGSELNNKYFKVATSRLTAAALGDHKHRPIERPIHSPDPDSGISKVPSHFKFAAE
jgi:adenine-specific DNA-methyltransferase